MKHNLSLVSLFLHISIVFKGEIFVNGKHQKVLLIGLDGFRWDFLSNNKELFPNINSLTSNGVSVTKVENVFPTNTLPNYYSIVTGLYAENHGIIDNQMIDQRTGDKFSMENSDSKWWSEAEPIWITNQKQGHKSGVCYWPGFNVKIQGMLPSFYVSIENNKYGNPLTELGTKPMMPSNEKIDTALHWLQQPGVTLAAVYFQEPDHTNHGSGHGPGSQNKVQSTAKNLDDAFGHLKQQLATLNLNEQVNVIVVGDHGSTSVSSSRIINLNNFLNVTKYIEITTGTTFISIYPKKKQLKKVYEKLHNAHQHMKVYLKKDLPDSLHIKNNQRTAPLLILADRGWLINTGFEDHVYFKTSSFERGEHGYDSSLEDMHTGFFAFGPTFKQHATFDKIRSIDVYSLMCYILDLKPKRNDGSLDSIIKLLNHS